ncbi:DpnD/PcfM family protein [Megamonas hypermegale]|uniref:DpnD/PcfM family protein n=1 Tax=Megamonas hypermegale TaxID=158847 RepID=UPI00320B15EF
MNYTITIEETVSDTFEVEANNLNEATEKAIQNYNEAIFILELGNVTATHMQAVSEDEKEDSDWFEF